MIATYRDRSPLVCIAAAASYGILLAVAKAVPRYDCIALPIVLWLVFRRLDDATPRGRAFGLHGVTLVLLGSFLLHLWTLGYEGRNAVFGGILPWSDSYDYYGDSLRLLHGDRFAEVGSKRPLFSVALAAILRVNGGDLRIAFVVFAVVGAWATALASLEVWKTHGYRSALVVYLALLFIERRWTGFVQTEHFGLPLGAIAFVLVWRANAMRGDPSAHARARRLVLAALFALTLALLARTGSFFVLPALGLWAARTFLPRDRRRRLGFLAVAGGVVLAGFAENRAIVAAAGSGVMFSDYPGIVYGMMHGKGFDHLGRKHPELSALPIGERVPAAWGVVRSEAKERPTLLAGGLLRSGAGLFVSPSGMFGYAWTNPDDHVLEDTPAVRASMREHGMVLGPLLLWRERLGLHSLLNAGAMALLGVALVVSSLGAAYVVFVRRRRDPELSLLRWSFAGILLSAPFLPPSITSGQQTQTATMAFAAALPAVVFLARRDRAAARPGPYTRLVLAPPAIGAALALAVVWMRVAPARPPPCGAEEHLVRVFSTTDVEVAASRPSVLAVRTNAEADLRASLPLLSKHNGELVRSVTPFIRPGTRYVFAYDACDSRAKVLVDDARALPASAGPGTWTPIEATPLATPAVLHVQRPVPVLP